jgi:peptidoglycan/LPS O-acetylase OafA/YrhL
LYFEEEIIITKQSKKQSLNRLDFIDAIRGLAALYVVTYHLVLIPNPRLDLPFFMTSFVLHGDTGVTLFFIASVFTLAYSVKKRYGNMYKIKERNISNYMYSNLSYLSEYR